MKFFNYYGNIPHNTWTILDENSDCGYDDNAEDADADGSAEEQ